MTYIIGVCVSWANQHILYTNGSLVAFLHTCKKYAGWRPDQKHHNMELGTVYWCVYTCNIHLCMCTMQCTMASSVPFFAFSMCSSISHNHTSVWMYISGSPIPQQPFHHIDQASISCRIVAYRVRNNIRPTAIFRAIPYPDRLKRWSLGTLPAQFLAEGCFITEPEGWHRRETTRLRWLC